MSIELHLNQRAADSGRWNISKVLFTLYCIIVDINVSYQIDKHYPFIILMNAVDDHLSEIDRIVADHIISPHSNQNPGLRQVSNNYIKYRQIDKLNYEK